MAKTIEKEKAKVTHIIVVSELRHLHSFNGSLQKATKEDETATSTSALTVQLIPGSNFFTGKKLEEFQAIVAVHPDFLRMVDEGEMRLIDASATKLKKGADAPDSLKGIDDSKMAISIIQGTMNAELLKTWQDEEERESVKAALRDQIKVVTDFDDIRAKAQAEA